MRATAFCLMTSARNRKKKRKKNNNKKTKPWFKHRLWDQGMLFGILIGGWDGADAVVKSGLAPLLSLPLFRRFPRSDSTPSAALRVFLLMTHTNNDWWLTKLCWKMSLDVAAHVCKSSVRAGEGWDGWGDEGSEGARESHRGQTGSNEFVPHARNFGADVALVMLTGEDLLHDLALNGSQWDVGTDFSTFTPLSHQLPHHACYNIKIED